MASVSATHLIMFIGSLVIASAVAGTVIMEVGQVSDSIETRGSTVAEEIETDIAIISDESQSDAMVEPIDAVENGGDGDGDGYNVTVLTKNIGNQDIPADQRVVDGLVDGSYATVTNVERVDDDGDTWQSGGVAAVTMEATGVSGDTTATVLVNGDEDTITFHREGDDENGNEDEDDS